MEKLPPETQEDIRKLSTERLIAYLIRAGSDEETIFNMDRPQLFDAWAELVAAGQDKLSNPKIAEVTIQQMNTAGIDLDLQRRMFEFEIRRYEEERRVKEEEREERRRREEEERRAKEEEREERRKIREEERELKLKELQLKEEELTRQASRDKEMGEKRQSLASRTKLFGEAMKNIFWKLPQDPAEMPGYFDHVENLFALYEVDEDVKSKLLQAHLSDKAKALTARLSRQQLDDYDALKAFILNEFKISPIQLRERFFTLRKSNDETFTLLASKLRNALIYYLRSRNIDNDFDKFVSLLCADRLKELIPKGCLNFILAQEKDDWLRHDELAHSIDIYMASHDRDGVPLIPGDSSFKHENRGQKFTKSNDNVRTLKSEVKVDLKSENKPNKEEAMRKGLCFNCYERGHTAKNCSKQKDASSNKRPARVNACAANPSHCVAQSITRAASEHEHTNFVHTTCEFDQLDDDNVNKSESTLNDKIDVGLYKPYIDADEFQVRSYVDVNIEGLPQQKALIDGGSEICCISDSLVNHLKLPVCKQVLLSGLQGKSDIVDVVRLHVKPVSTVQSGIVNIAPTVRVWFAVVPELNESVILTPNVVSLLHDISRYNVLSLKANDIIENVSDDVNRSLATDCQYMNMDERATVNTDNEGNASVTITEQENVSEVETTTEETTNKLSHQTNKPLPEMETEEFFDTEKPKYDRVADVDTLAAEQRSCPSLFEYWELAKQNKNNFIIDNTLLYHRDMVLGHKIKQLCLPECRVPIVLEMGHDAPFAGHMAFKATRHRIRLSFWFPKMDERIRSYCTTCSVCQMRAPVKVSDRVPITPIPRHDELPFTHLVMDCIGPILPEGDPSVPKPEYNYALVIVDKYSRWPMAYPLRSLNAKAACDALLQVFMTFSIPKVISSDCGSNFTSKLMQEFLKRLGCSPRFNTPGHPEASGLVERCNQSLKTMIYKLAQSDPRGWFRLLPFVLWSLREKPSSTTHISPYTLVYGTLPKGPLNVLKESWAGERELPFSIGKKPEEYLQTLKENLELAKVYADYYSEIEQKRYADHYNMRSTDRKYLLGDKVIILAPDLGGAKLYSRWQGPGTIVQVKSPYSYIVEVDGKRRHVHANKIRKFNERIEQAVVNNCSVIFEKDEEFGSVDVIPDIPLVNEPPPSSKIDPVRVSHLTNNEKQQLFAVLDKYPEVFSEKPGFCPLFEHEIKVTSDFKPKKLRAYKVPELLKPEVERQIKEMLELGIIVPSNSEMASPVVCVLKGPNGQNGVRLAIDYRHVNRYSIGDCFPTPDISDVLQKVGRAKYISCFDAKSGYWQLPVKKESRWLTAFVCDAGLFEFNRMPFGLKSASNTFIRCISRVLHPIRAFTEPFVDDMSVFSMTWEEHLRHLDKFLETIKNSGMTLSPKKCSFAQSKVTFVGHVIGSGQIIPDPVKIATVSNLQPPTTKKDVRRLIGFFSYFRNFIPSLAETARVLTDLTQKNIPNRVPWRSEHQKALDKLKSDLCNATVLHTIDFSKDFGLLVDASANAIGCCLIQWTDDGSEKPIAFASMKLSTTQTHWSTIEREAFAVIWALKKFRSWIFLSKIIIFSDHNPLSFLTEAAPKSAKLTRWALALQEFNVDFRYRSGRRHAAADFLSRI